MGEIFLFIFSTFSGTTSTATTSFRCANKVAMLNPTYPVPATAIFILLIRFVYFVYLSSITPQSTIFHNSCRCAARRFW